MSKQLNIPTLRFPEFKGEWEKKKLGALFSISAGGDIESKNVSQTKTDVFKYPIYANAEKNKGFFGYSDIYKVEENVLTIAGRGVNIGIAHARNHKFYPIVRLLVLKPLNNENIYFFENEINRLNLYKESTGVPQLTAPQVSAYEVTFPTLPEQTKIASFFTAVNEKIGALKKKKNLLEQYKKGVMQQLFSPSELGFKGLKDEQDFDTTNPKILKSSKSRFRQENGKEFPDWEVKKLGEVCEITIGEFVIKTKQNPNGKYPVFNGGIAPTGYYDDFNNEGNKIIVSARGANAGFVNFQKEKYWAGNSCYSISLKDEKKYSIIYFYYFVKMFENKFIENQQAANIPSVSKKDAELFEILLPNLEEQTKIANFLSSIDEKINHTATQIEKMEVWKKGLLQKMFV
jgi:type I restriction enzyme S subunit